MQISVNGHILTVDGVEDDWTGHIERAERIEDGYVLNNAELDSFVVKWENVINQEVKREYEREAQEWLNFHLDCKAHNKHLDALDGFH